MDITVPIVLLALGVVAFFLEAFVPSGGVITVVGLGCVGVAVGIAFSQSGAETGIIFLGIAIVLVPTALIAAFMLLPRTPIGKRLTLNTSQKAEAGYVAQDIRERQLVGRTGVALSPLRPSGEARIGDQRYDVITSGEMIEKGTDIVVSEVSGNRIVVRRAQTKTESS